jgi:hypothetical protein
MTAIRSARPLALGAALGVALALSACQTSTAPTTPVVQAPAPSVRGELVQLANPANPFGVAVWSGNSLRPRLGEKLLLGMRTDADAYVSLYTVSASGQTARLFENRRMRAGAMNEFPSRDSRVDFMLSPPAGVESFVVVASQQPLSPLSPADVLRSGSVTTLRLDSYGLADRLRGATAMLSPAAWNAAVVDIVTTP